MFRIIINDILRALIQYAPNAIFAGLFTTFFIVWVKSWLLGQSVGKTICEDRKKYLRFLILFSYCIFVVYITYFSREPGSRDGIDLIPLSTISCETQNNVYPVENILLFLPFGYLLAKRKKGNTSLKYCLAVGLLFSLAIEVLQLITKRGYFQTDDLITNVLGTLIGYGIFKTERKVRKGIGLTEYFFM